MVHGTHYRPGTWGPPGAAGTHPTGPSSVRVGLNRTAAQGALLGPTLSGPFLRASYREREH